MKKIDTSHLSRIPLFTGIDSQKLEKIKSILIERKVEQGDAIIREGETGGEVFILMDGTVEISRTLLLKVSGHGMNQRDKSLIRLTGGDHAFFGEMALFDEQFERTASVTAKSECLLAVIGKDAFFRLAESDYEIGYHVMKNISRILTTRLAKTTQDVLKLTTALSLALER